nr:general transcription and DNA repair factor IIH helicase subunit [Andalucia godoyi]|eukprot:ANDGO_04861.mRNA.1 DNA repair helicase XPD
MRFHIEEVEVLFPYEYIYPEQYRYMVELKRALDAHGHGVLEMPSGTGKTITLLSFITSYQFVHPERSKLIYCTRTVPEMEKTLEELKRLIEFRKTMLGDAFKDVLAIGLSARKNMCCHPTVSEMWEGAQVDAGCRSLTASWVRERAKTDPAVPSCPFFEGLEAAGTTAILPSGVYTLADIHEFGKQRSLCPYFMSRRMISFSNIIVYNYQYLLDPKISSIISKELTRDCIVVFDEAHNIDNVCIEALSVNVDSTMLLNSARNLQTLRNKIDEVQERNADRLRTEYRKLRDGLAAAGLGVSDDLRGNPVLPADILYEAVPGNIRKAEHFLLFLRRLIDYVQSRMASNSVIQESPSVFMAGFEAQFAVDVRALRFCSDRLRSLLIALEVTEINQFSPVRALSDFGTLMGTYDKGFEIVIEPYDPRTPTIHNPVLQLACVDASLAIRPVFAKFDSVVITSGTLSPLDMYPKMLDFRAAVTASFPITLPRNCMCPLIVSKGPDQTPISSEFSVRNTPAVIRNFGELLLDVATVVPDGILCFFPSYLYMEDVISVWNDMGVMAKLSEKKLIYLETPGTAETSRALEHYRRACDVGRGAVFFSIARGKVAEGVDFEHHYGRVVIMFGIPYMYTESKVLKARLRYLSEIHHIKEQDFLTFDAIRQASQCIGRVIRNKTDYGMMILADKRYRRSDKREKLPKWIQEYLYDYNTDLLVSTAVDVVRKFFREMSQATDLHKQMMGTALWDEAYVNSLGQLGQPSAAQPMIVEER